MMTKMILAVLAALPIVAIACPTYCACDSRGHVVYTYTPPAPSSTSTSGAGSTASSTATSTNSNVNTVTGGNSSASASIAAGAVKNTVTATGGAGGSASATGGNVTNTVAGGTASQHQGQSQSTSNSGNNTGSSETNVSSVYQASRIPVSTAYSASLTSGLDTCLGSASGGIQTVPVGLTFGSTKVDKNCVLIKQTKLLREEGLLKSACVRMTLGKEGALIRQAMSEAGESCDQVDVPVPASAVTQADIDALSRKIDRVIKQEAQK